LGQCQGLCQKQRKVDAENRQFQDNWKGDYYFILNKSLPVFYFCGVRPVALFTHILPKYTRDRN
jgi:hypothetical protein